MSLDSDGNLQIMKKESSSLHPIDWRSRPIIKKQIQHQVLSIAQFVFFFNGVKRFS